MKTQNSVFRAIALFMVAVMVVPIVGCSQSGEKLSNGVVNPELTVNAASLVKNGVLHFPEDFSNVIGTSDTTIIDYVQGAVSASADDNVIRAIILPNGTEYKLIHPVVDFGNTGSISSEDQANLRQMVSAASALGASITNYYLKDNEWVYAVIMESSDQAWVYYNPRKVGYKTLKFKNNIVWNYEVLMLPSWRNASSGWNQWTAWWCAPWYTYKTLYSGSVDIAYLFVVVQNNNKSASVMMTVY
ncbi:MAG: hypothetical protein WCT27_04975 [Patescibacteria group bacterium]